MKQILLIYQTIGKKGSDFLYTWNFGRITC